MAQGTDHRIVILGGSFAGLKLAHLLLKQLQTMRQSSGKNFKVVLVSNSSHFWFTVGAPRAMFQPYPNDLMDSFKPISKGFAKYPASDFEFVLGHVTGINTESRAVTYQAKSNDETVAETPSTLPYDSLIIATGSRGPSPLYSVQDSHVPTLEAYKQLHAQVPTAKSIAIIGGGSAGTETAAEVAYVYGKNHKTPKEITFYTGSSRVLPGLQQAIGASAEQKLTGLGVKVIHNAKLDSSTKLSSGATEVAFSNGETKSFDVVIVATGRKAHAPFLPATIPTNDKGRIVVDKQMRVPSQSGIWAIGDIGGESDGTVMHIQFAIPVAANNIIADLSGKGKPKDFKPMTTKEMQLVPLGPQDGVGAMFGYKVPAFMVKMIKGKNYMFPSVGEWVDGK